MIGASLTSTTSIVTVQSPFVQCNALNVFPTDPHCFTDSPHSSPTAASFHQERGIGQGDTPSAILWVALYDILLSMLDTPATNTSGHFLARGPLRTLYAAGSISYADDLCTPAGTLALSQFQADVVSTFCAATTLLCSQQSFSFCSQQHCTPRYHLVRLVLDTLHRSVLGYWRRNDVPWT